MHIHRLSSVFWTYFTSKAPHGNKDVILCPHGNKDVKLCPQEMRKKMANILRLYCIIVYLNKSMAYDKSSVHIFDFACNTIWD